MWLKILIRVTRIAMLKQCKSKCFLVVILYLQKNKYYKLVSKCTFAKNLDLKYKILSSNINSR